MVDLGCSSWSGAAHGADHTFPAFPNPTYACRAVHGLHTPRFTLDEGVLKLGTALHAALATEYLAQYKQRQQQEGAAAAAREEL